MTNRIEISVIELGESTTRTLSAWVHPKTEELRLYVNDMSLSGCAVYLVEGEGDKIKACGRFSGGRPSPTLRALGYRNAIDFACDELAVVQSAGFSAWSGLVSLFSQ